MRIRLEATEEELAERGDALVDGLCKALEPVAPGLAAELRKAGERAQREQAASAPALQGLLKIQRDEYARLNRLMVAEIVRVVERTGKGKKQ